MKVQIVWHEMDRNQARESVILDKLAALDKLLADWDEEMKEAVVRVEKGERWGYKVSFSMRIAKNKIFAEAHEDDLVKTVVAVREKVERQIKEMKGDLSWKGGS